MKVKIELDLRRAQAREIFGLLDFSQLHSTITADLAEKFAEDPQTTDPEATEPKATSGGRRFAHSDWEDNPEICMEVINRQRQRPSAL